MTSDPKQRSASAKREHVPEDVTLEERARRFVANINDYPDPGEAVFFLTTEFLVVRNDAIHEGRRSASASDYNRGWDEGSKAAYAERVALLEEVKNLRSSNASPYPRIDIHADGDWHIGEGHGGFYRALGPSRSTPEEALAAGRRTGSAAPSDAEVFREVCFALAQSTRPLGPGVPGATIEKAGKMLWDYACFKDPTNTIKTVIGRELAEQYEPAAGHNKSEAHVRLDERKKCRDAAIAVASSFHAQRAHIDAWGAASAANNIYIGPGIEPFVGPFKAGPGGKPWHHECATPCASDGDSTLAPESRIAAPAVIPATDPADEAIVDRLVAAKTGPGKPMARDKASEGESPVPLSGPELAAKFGFKPHGRDPLTGEVKRDVLDTPVSSEASPERCSRCVYIRTTGDLAVRCEECIAKLRSGDAPPDLRAVLADVADRVTNAVEFDGDQAILEIIDTALGRRRESAPTMLEKMAADVDAAYAASGTEMPSVLASSDLPNSCAVVWKRLEDAIDRLSNLFPYGHLLASTDTAQLLNEASNEIERLRDALRICGDAGCPTAAINASPFTSDQRGSK